MELVIKQRKYFVELKQRKYLEYPYRVKSEVYEDEKRLATCKNWIHCKFASTCRAVVAYQQ